MPQIIACWLYDLNICSEIYNDVSFSKLSARQELESVNELNLEPDSQWVRFVHEAW